METKLVEIKAAITAVFAALGIFLGWKGKMLLIWFTMMVADYVSGYIAAKLNGTWKSEIARKGVAHKFGMILVVVGSAMADVILSIACMQFPEIGIKWPFLISPFMVFWYCLTEFGSIMENAAELGAPIPSWLTTGLKISMAAADVFGNKVKGNE